MNIYSRFLPAEIWTLHLFSIPSAEFYIAEINNANNYVIIQEY